MVVGWPAAGSLVSAAVVIVGWGWREYLGVSFSLTLWVAGLLAALADAVGGATGGLSHRIERCLTAAGLLFGAAVLLGASPTEWTLVAFCWYWSAVFALPERSRWDRGQLGETLWLGSIVGRPSNHMVVGMLGAWVGCFAIPLDWDVAWQQFPVASSLSCAVLSIASPFIFSALTSYSFFKMKSEVSDLD